MKISAKQYARALQEITDDKTATEQSQLIAEFLQVLKKQGRWSLADKIVTELSNRLLIADGVVAAEVSSARPLNEATLKELRRVIKNKTACQEVNLIETIEPDLLGGAVIKYQDKIIDASFQYFLQSLKSVLNR